MNRFQYCFPADHSRLFLRACLWVAFAWAPACLAATNPYPGKTTTLASGWEVWVPEGINPLRGIWIDEGGASHDRTNICAIWKFAILAYVAEKKPDTKVAMEAILNDAAAKTGHAEIKHAPFVAYGGSRNGGFPVKLAEWFPDKCIAYACALSKPTAGGNKIPRFFDSEEGRAEGAIASMKNDMQGFRSKGELVGYGPMWGWGHGYYSIRDIHWPFFDQVIELRLPKDKTPVNGPVALKDISESDGWLGNPDTWSGDWPEAASFAQFKGSKAGAAWLPNEHIAAVWKAYVSKDPKMTNRQAGTGWVGGSGGDFSDLSAPPGVEISSPTRPYHLGKVNGKDYPAVAQNSVVTLQVTNVRFENIAKIQFFDGARKIAEPPVNAYKIWSVRCTLSVVGVRSLIVHLTLKDGKMATSRPATIYVQGADIYKGTTGIFSHEGRIRFEGGKGGLQPRFNLANRQLSLFAPNHSTQAGRIRLWGTSGRSEIALAPLLGNADGETRYDLSALPAGTYLADFSEGGNRTSSRGALVTIP